MTEQEARQLQPGDRVTETSQSPRGVGIVERVTDSVVTFHWKAAGIRSAAHVTNLANVQRVEPDVMVEPHGSIWRFVPVSETAKTWITEHVQIESWQWFGNGVCVDHRFAHGLVEAMREHGLTVVAQA